METTKKTGPKDVFLQLLAIIGLYVSVVSFGALVFELINIYLPDVLSGPFGHYAYQSLRWPLSILTIVWPLFIWLSWYLFRDLERSPEKRELRIRKWLVAFTLFLAAIVIAGDFVAVIYNFLNGELTLRFLLKALTVLFVAAAVFMHYLWEPKIFDLVVVALVVAAVIFGFYVAGSPFAERARRFDERRISDLQIIQSEIINFWQRKEKLPQSLGELKDDIRGFTPPVDPETGKFYEYRTTGDLSFELCAVFNASNKNQTPAGVPKPEGPYGGESWLHEAGRVCFSRTIDPEIYLSYGKDTAPRKPLR